MDDELQRQFDGLAHDIFAHLQELYGEQLAGKISKLERAFKCRLTEGSSIQWSWIEKNDILDWKARGFNVVMDNELYVDL